MKEEIYEIENTGLLKLAPPAKIYPIVITVDREDGSVGSVSLVWDRKTATLELEVKNCELEDGARKLFEHIKGFMESWQEDFYNDRLAVERKE